MTVFEKALKEVSEKFTGETFQVQPLSSSKNDEVQVLGQILTQPRVVAEIIYNRDTDIYSIKYV